MKYILLIYSAANAWPPEEHQVALQESIDLCHRLHEQGQYVAASPLQPATEATCVTVRGQSRTVKDGPYAETKEQLAGYFVIDVASLDEAVEVAARIPGTSRGITEIRPLVELDSLPQR